MAEHQRELSFSVSTLIVGFSGFFNLNRTIMHADLQGALDQINRSYKAFEHRGKKMTKEQVRKVLQYGLKKGYKTTAELTDDEVDTVLNFTNEEPKSV